VLEKQVGPNKFEGRIIYEDEHDFDDPFLDIDVNEGKDF